MIRKSNREIPRGFQFSSPGVFLFFSQKNGEAFSKRYERAGGRGEEKKGGEPPRTRYRRGSILKAARGESKKNPFPQLNWISINYSIVYIVKYKRRKMNKRDHFLRTWGKPQNRCFSYEKKANRDCLYY